MEERAGPFGAGFFVQAGPASKVRASLRRQYGDGYSEEWLALADAVFLKNKPIPGAADIDWVSLESLIEQLRANQFHPYQSASVTTAILEGYTELKAATYYAENRALQSRDAERRRFWWLETGFAVVFPAGVLLVYVALTLSELFDRAAGA